jgi:hypothetical protein
MPEPWKREMLVFGHNIAELTKETKEKQTPWTQSASELYRPSDRRMSANLVPTFAGRGVPRSQRGGSPTAVISDF